MKKSMLAMTLGMSLAIVAHAEENPAVAAAQSANDTIAACVTSTTAAIGASNLSEGSKVLMIAQAPANCRAAVVIPSVRQAPTTGEMVWDGTKFVIGLWAGYKQQALMFSAITGIVDRMSSSQDAAVTQGFNTANNGMEVTGNLAGQAIGKLPTPVWPSAGAAATESVGN